MKMSPAQTSRARKKLVQMAEEIRDLVNMFCAREQLVKGNVYLMKRMCGKERCICKQGSLHASWVLSASEEGRTRIRTVKKEELARLQEKTRQYRRFRKARARVVGIHKEMLELIDSLDKARRKEP